MKRIHLKSIVCLLAIATIFGFQACKTKPDANAIHEELQSLHNQLMMNSGKLIRNRMLLDTLYKADLNLRSAKKIADTLAEKKKIASLIEKLNLADTEMMDWMHNFNNEYKGTEAESLAYYQSEMVKVHKIDHNYDALSKTSDSLLKVYQVKNVSEAPMGEMHHH